MQRPPRELVLDAHWDSTHTPAARLDDQRASELTDALTELRETLRRRAPFGTARRPGLPWRSR